MRENNGDCTYKFSAFSYWLGANAGMKEPYLSVFPFISSFHFALKCSICSPFRKLSFHISGTYLSFSYMLHLVVSVVALSCWRNIIFCDRCKLGILETWKWDTTERRILKECDVHAFADGMLMTRCDFKPSFVGWNFCDKIWASCGIVGLVPQTENLLCAEGTIGTCESRSRAVYWTANNSS